MGSERLFQSYWLVEEDDARIVQPSVIDLPRFSLVHHLWTHHSRCRKQPQQTKLGYPAETQAGLLTPARKPVRSDRMVDMPLRRESDPDIHVREKE
jgi:hypothetical protein